MIQTTRLRTGQYQLPRDFTSDLSEYNKETARMSYPFMGVSSCCLQRTLHAESGIGRIYIILTKSTESTHGLTDSILLWKESKLSRVYERSGSPLVFQPGRPVQGVMTASVAGPMRQTIDHVPSNGVTLRCTILKILLRFLPCISFRFFDFYPHDISVMEASLDCLLDASFTEK